MTEELKPLPCPFCGGSKLSTKRCGSDDECHYVRCDSCEAGGPTITGPRYEGADWNTRYPAWRDDMEAAKEYQYSRHGRGDDRLGVIVVCQWGSRWSANHAWWNDHEEEWNDISGDQIVHPVYWAPLPPKLKVGGEHDNDK